MKHIHHISTLPSRAQTEATAEICTDIGNDYQAQLCFLVELLTSFFLPVLQLKVSTDPNA